MWLLSGIGIACAYSKAGQGADFLYFDKQNSSIHTGE